MGCFTGNCLCPYRSVSAFQRSGHQLCRLCIPWMASSISGNKATCLPISPALRQVNSFCVLGFNLAFTRSVYGYGHYSSGQYRYSVRKSLRAGYLTSAFKYLRLFWRSYRLWGAWTRSTWLASHEDEEAGCVGPNVSCIQLAITLWAAQDRSGHLVCPSL